MQGASLQLVPRPSKESSCKQHAFFGHYRFLLVSHLCIVFTQCDNSGYCGIVKQLNFCNSRKGGYCRDTSYLEKPQETGQQHVSLEEALRSYGYDVTSLTLSTSLWLHLLTVKLNDASLRMLGNSAASQI